MPSCDERRRREFLKASGTALAGGMAGVAGCLSSIGGDETVTLRHSIVTGPDSLEAKLAEWVSEDVDLKTDGQVQIEVFPNAELGGISESMEAISAGSIDLYSITFSVFGAIYGPIQVFDAPYLYDSYEHIINITQPEESDIMAEMNQGLIDAGNVRVLGAQVQGTRRLTIKGDPVYAPADLEGKTVRAVPSDMMFETVNGLGAEAVTVDFSELPTALETGSVNGQENPYNVIVDAGLHELQDYLIETNHIDAPHPIYMNEDSFQGLDEEHQQAILESVQENIPRGVSNLREGQSELRQVVRDAGMEIIPPEEIEMEEFRTQTRRHVRESFPDFIDTIEQIHGGSYGTE